jgi:hypothetical protein
MKILVLGNEFIEKDSLAKRVGSLLKEDFDVVEIRDSFQLMGELALQEEMGNGKWGVVILDVVKELDEVREIGVGDLRVDSILSAHDFDAGYVLALFGHDSGEPGLMGENVRIIGIPMEGDELETRKDVLKILLGI